MYLEKFEYPAKCITRLPFDYKSPHCFSGQAPNADQEVCDDQLEEERVHEATARLLT